jgi:hypothetical protein
MSSVLFALFVAAATASPARVEVDSRGGAERAARAARPLAPFATTAALEPASLEIVVTVVAVPDQAPSGASSVLDLGSVSYASTARVRGRSSARAAADVIVMRRMVSVRIGTVRAGFAPLRARLGLDDSRCRILVDGRVLTAVPQIVDPLSPLGLAVTHVVEIEIPVTASEGLLSASIEWTSDQP